MRHEAEMRAILKQVELWPTEERQWLVTALALGDGRSEAVVPSRSPVPVDQRESLSDLIGIANPEGRSFTDEEIDDIRYEALKEKHLK